MTCIVSSNNLLRFYSFLNSLKALERGERGGLGKIAPVSAPFLRLIGALIKVETDEIGGENCPKMDFKPRLPLIGDEEILGCSINEPLSVAEENNIFLTTSQMFGQKTLGEQNLSG